MTKHFKTFQFTHHEVILFKEAYGIQFKIIIINDLIQKTNLVTFFDEEGNPTPYEKIQESHILRFLSDNHKAAPKMFPSEVNENQLKAELKDGKTSN